MRAVATILGGFVLGVLALALARFAFAGPPEPPHFHANWAVFVDGERLAFTGEEYMEDVAACAAGEHVHPAGRVHMHNGEDRVVHVHHEGVTWGHLLENLGFDAGRDYLMLDGDRRWFAGEGRTVKYIVNGFALDRIDPAEIHSGDRVLISFGPETLDQVLAEQFPQVPADAERYNVTQDPAGCAGARETTMGERLRWAFWG